MDYQAVIHKKEVNFPVLIYITDTQKHYSVKIKGIAGCICYNPIYVKKKGVIVRACFTVTRSQSAVRPYGARLPWSSQMGTTLPPTEQPKVLNPPLADMPVCLAHTRDPGPFFQLPREASIPVPNYCHPSPGQPNS